jgi:hypothetical protein
MIRFSEALILGTTFPLCRGSFRRGEAGCLLTNALRAVGVTAPCGILYQCRATWPELFNSGAMPPFWPEGATDDHAFDLADWIMTAFDGGMSPDRVADAIRGLEDALNLYPEAPAVEQPVADLQAVAA